MSSSTHRNWLLGERNDDYRRLKFSDPKEYFAGIRQEWAYRRAESERLRNELIAMGARVPIRHSLDMFPRTTESSGWDDYRRKVIQAVKQLRIENNRMLLRRTRQYIYQLAKDSVRASGRELTHVEEQHLQQNPCYISDDYMSDEEI